MKKIALLALSLILMFTVVACDDNTTPTTVLPVETNAVVTDAVETDAVAEQEFTLDELAAFDGKDGNKAYVAVDGVVYDLTDSQAWKDGQHNGFEAGKDLTDEIKNDSPHGVGNLEGIPVVGKLVD